MFSNTNETIGCDVMSCYGGKGYFHIILQLQPLILFFRDWLIMRWDEEMIMTSVHVMRGWDTMGTDENKEIIRSEFDLLIVRVDADANDAGIVLWAIHFMPYGNNTSTTIISIRLDDRYYSS